MDKLAFPPIGNFLLHFYRVVFLAPNDMENYHAGQQSKFKHEGELVAQRLVHKKLVPTAMYCLRDFLLIKNINEILIINKAIPYFFTTAAASDEFLAKYILAAGQCNTLDTDSEKYL